MRPGDELVEGDQPHARPRTAGQASVTGETLGRAIRSGRSQLRGTFRSGVGEMSRIWWYLILGIAWVWYGMLAERMIE
jgi:hypothetical protein